VIDEAMCSLDTHTAHEVFTPHLTWAFNRSFHGSWTTMTLAMR